MPTRPRSRRRTKPVVGTPRGKGRAARTAARATARATARPSDPCDTKRLKSARQKGTADALGAMSFRALSPIITMDASGVIQSASDSVEGVFGWTPTELFGKNVKLLIPEPRRSALDRYLDRYRHADQAKTLTRTRRFFALRKDGTGLQIELSVSRADLPLSSAPHFIGIIRDVTSQIDPGLDSPENRTKLHKLITEQTCALATAHLRLQMADRLASLGTLAAGLGHDINNVLLPIRARLNALEHAGVAGPALVHLHAVRRSIVYLQHLTDGLHFITLDPDGPSSTDDGRGLTKLSRWWTQVGPLLRTAVPKSVTVGAVLGATLPAVNIGPHWLTQAMLNLIVNAGEAIGAAARAPGKAGARASRRRGVVRISAKTSDDGRAVHLSVADNGVGMNATVLRRATDLFFTTKSRGLGTGLGLPLARKIALRAGGELLIRSSPRAGTVVTMVLPIAVSTGAASPAGDSPPSEAAPARIAAISVADTRQAALISQILIAAGFRPRETGDRGPGRAAVWITRPGPRVLAVAQKWLRPGSTRTMLLLGRPASAARLAWSDLGAITIEPPDDFQALRHAIGVASTRARGEPAEPSGTPPAGTPPVSVRPPRRTRKGRP